MRRLDSPDEPAATYEYEPLAYGSALHLDTRVSFGWKYKSTVKALCNGKCRTGWIQHKINQLTGFKSKFKTNFFMPDSYLVEFIVLCHHTIILILSSLTYHLEC